MYTVFEQFDGDSANEIKIINLYGFNVNLPGAFSLLCRLLDSFSLIINHYQINIRANRKDNSKRASRIRIRHPSLAISLSKSTVGIFNC